MKKLYGQLAGKLYLIFFITLTLIFFSPFIFYGKIPLPADTIVGMYHPFRDAFSLNYPSGVPFKNFLITDPVRQQYVWRWLSLEELKKLRLPIWNPYSFSGTPLLANFQSASLYPLNIFFFLLPFPMAWGMLILMEPLLAGAFLYLYLRKLKLAPEAVILGSLTFAFSGFSVAWLEWNTLLQTALWLPLILLSEEHLLESFSYKWLIILTFAGVSALLGGHLQIFYYLVIVSISYLIARISFKSVREEEEIKEKISRAVILSTPFLIAGAAIILITSPQWLPSLRFITLSARSVDQGSFLKEGWFIPWQNLIQYIIPDFFGNPATNNYWGVWNYGEFIGYIGIVPLLFALYSIGNIRKNRFTLFFFILTLVSLIFELPTYAAKIPYILSIPYLSTSQPTRMLFITDFSLAVLSATGIGMFLKSDNRSRITELVLFLGIIFFIIWILIFPRHLFRIGIPDQYLAVSRRNILLPTLIYGLVLILTLFYRFNLIKNRKIITFLFILLTVIDLFRFGWKFLPFSDMQMVYPTTRILEKMQSDKDIFRFSSLDRRIMPPNFSVFYHLEDVSGYDPLYLKIYGELAASWERGKADITDASFNRIITPDNPESFINDLLGVKYVLNYGPLESKKYQFVLSEGRTYLYNNPRYFPRAYFVDSLIKVKNSQEAIEKMYSLGDNLRHTAVVTGNIELESDFSQGDTLRIIGYSPENMNILTSTGKNRFMVISEIYYPGWRATVDGKNVEIILTDFALRGILVPRGNHIINLKIGLI